MKIFNQKINVIPFIIHNLLKKLYFLANAFFIKYLFDMTLNNKSNNLIQFSIYYLLVFIFINFLLSIINYLNNKNKMKKADNVKIYLHIKVLDLEDTTQGFNTVEITKRIDKDLDTIISTKIDINAEIIGSLLITLIYLYILYKINLLFLIVLLVSSLLFFISPLIFSNTFKSDYEKQTKIEETLEKTIKSSIDNFLIIKLYNLQKYYSMRYSISSKDVTKISFNNEKNDILNNVLLDTVNIFLKVILVMTSFYLFTKGKVPLTDALFLLFIANSLKNIISSMFKYISKLKSQIIAKSRIEELFHEKRDNLNNVDFIREIQFKDVSLFHQIKDKKICVSKNISFRISKKSVNLVHGDNGSGKSTLVSTLLGLNKSYSGNILLNGINLRQIDVRSLRRKIAYMPQESTLLNQTGYENIYAITNNEYNLDKMNYLMNELNLTDEILKMNINEISGGEKRKVELLSLLLKNYDVLILDEFENNLDLDTINNINKLLYKLDKIVIIISHRISNLDEFQNKILIGGMNEKNT
ncbi:ABC transporter ATP-binding protein [Mycoplasmatota bacterium]|nr:ABC transporter ATP-binding protein [Mycoplasmatota bacterium]